MEQSQITWGSTKIPYSIQRSPRRATVAIAVEPSGAVLITAPTGASLAVLDKAVHKKARWIVDRVRRRSDLPPPPQREFASGETMLYLGRQYRLRIGEAREPSPARLERGELVVAVHAHLEASQRAQEARDAVVAWYKGHAKERLPERVGVWAHKLGVVAPRVLVREQRLRWGSCDSSGTLRLNWRIVQAPTRLIDYVVVHELAHLIHRDHTRAFWSVLAKASPGYETDKTRLLELGARLVW